MLNDGTTGTDLAPLAVTNNAVNNSRYFTGHTQFSTALPRRQALSPRRSLDRRRTAVRSLVQVARRPESFDRFGRLHLQ